MAGMIDNIKCGSFKQVEAKEIGYCPSKIETSEFQENHVIVHLTEHRCSCGRLLGRFNGQAEVKCPKCGKMNVIGVENHGD